MAKAEHQWGNSLGIIESGEFALACD